MRKRPADQYKLFDIPVQLPNGFVYQPEFITKREEEQMVALFEELPLENAPYHEYTAKRRILSYGWAYDAAGNTIPGEPIPDFLKQLIQRIAKWTNIPRANIVQALITEYTPGAGVGWHCDNERCENVIGISFAGWADMQLRPLARHGDQKDITRLSLEPRSAYLMQLDSRWKYQHRIMPVETLRYSITFRTT